MGNQQGPKSIKRDIIISVGLKQTRAAILEDGRLAELLIDSDSDKRMVGDIYTAIVRKVLPGMQAAFVDIGLPKQAFLHVSDISDDMFEYELDEDEAEEERGGHRRRKLQAIQDQLREGQQILVQVTKEPIGTKGPRVTTEVSIPGRLLVYAPFESRLGISRKIDNQTERNRIKELVRKVITKREGIIVRTAAEDTSEDDFRNEYEQLKSLWRKIRRQASQAEAPALVYRETKLISGLLRDIFNERVDSLIIDNKEEFKQVKNYLKIIAPGLTDRIQIYDGAVPLFTHANLDEEVRKIFNRRVWLKKGGYIVIEQTEALVSIDVNTGRYTGEKDQEETILRTNLEAAREIARQVRLRDLGGIIVCDFIDMESKTNRQAVLDELRRWLKYDRAKTKAFDVSQLGLIEMSRQRVRSSLYHSLSEPCPTCEGRGRIFTPEVIATEIERVVRKVSAEGGEKQLMVRMHPVVALHLMEKEQDVIHQLEQLTGIVLKLRDDPMMQMDAIAVYSLPSQKQITIN